MPSESFRKSQHFAEMARQAKADGNHLAAGGTWSMAAAGAFQALLEEPDLSPRERNQIREHIEACLNSAKQAIGKERPL